VESHYCCLVTLAQSQTQTLVLASPSVCARTSHLSHPLHCAWLWPLVAREVQRSSMVGRPSHPLCDTGVGDFGPMTCELASANVSVACYRRRCCVHWGGLQRQGRQLGRPQTLSWGRRACRPGMSGGVLPQLPLLIGRLCFARYCGDTSIPPRFAPFCAPLSPSAGGAQPPCRLCG